MIRKFILTLLCSLIFITAFSQDQSKLVTDDQYNSLQKLAISFKKNSDQNRAKAFSLAKENNWTTFRVERDGTIISLQGVDDLGYPIYLTTFNNTTAAATTRTNSMYQGGSLGLSLNGSSSNLIGKVGIWDGGSILKEHQEFTGGRIVQKDSPSSSSEHSTHVAGTMMATGIYPVARGMAWGLQKLTAYDFNSDLSEMTTEASAGMLISNHSYGYIAGWNYNTDTTPARWEWYGLPTATEDYKFGFYDETTKSWDVICYNAPYYLPVKSAGNNRSENGPAVGTEYYGYTNATSTATFINKGARPSGISSNDSYDIISTTGTAKNILSVGAIYGLPFGASETSQIQIAPFSSWGPTDDGRIKPDIVTDGINLTSTSNTDTKGYAVLSGTSMSSPNVSGSLVLLQEYYSKLNGGAFMRSATLKGLAIETADEAGVSNGPDYIFGWGLLNTERAATLIKLNGTKSLISERTLAQGEIYNLSVITSGYGPLKVTICWTDPEGTPPASGTLNSRVPLLVNDLDLRLIKGNTNFFPWKLDPNNPSLAATQADNVVDNVEQIAIPNSVPGQVYTIRVSHKGTLTKGPQNYSIIASGIGGLVYCASAPSSTNDSRIDQFVLGSINNTLPNNCRGYSDFTNISTNLETGKIYPFTLKLGTCGASNDKVAKLFIDWNSDGDFEDSGETVATSSVENGIATFTGNIAVPTNVITGNSSLLRVVLTETSTSSSVTPCGTYTKGETQDYKINFTKSATDVGIIAINNITDNLCMSNAQQVSVKIKNFGSSTITNIPLTLILTNNNTVIKTITEIYTRSLLPNYEDDFVFSEGLSIQSGNQYIINVKTNLNSDPIIENNSITKTFNVIVPTAPTSLSATACDNAAGFYQLNGEGDGTLFWYTSANATLPTAIGNHPFSTIAPLANNTFYVGSNDFKSFFGPVNKYVYTGGTYSGNFGPKPEISVAAPMVLDSALLYTSKGGQLTFTVETTSGIILSSVTINVSKSKTTDDVVNANSQILDDPNDQGKMYKIGLEFPAAGTYRIGIAYNGATIFRSNSGVSNLPIILGTNLIVLNGAYFPSSTPTNITTSYYYFYNMLFKSLGCSDYTRKPVKISKPIITQAGTVLSSNFDKSNQWYLNGTVIAGATEKTFTPSGSGEYRVDITSSSGCISSSDNFSYVLSAIRPSDPLEIGLKVYPIPSNGILNLNFEAIKKDDIKISFTNLIGQEVLSESKNNFIGKFSESLDLRNLNDGIYILNLKIGSKLYTQKITLGK
nr:S8 family peptidase [Pseudopedobacter sp.]